MRLRIALSALVVACGLLSIGAVAWGKRNAAATTQDDSFPSAALKSPLHFLVHLPADYATTGKRYPVVYFLHGLPAGPTSYQSVAWVADALDRTGLDAILVVPQGTRRTGGDPEYHDWGPGENWETALAVELPRYVDSHYRTIATRSGRAIVGVSAGGYGATILGLHHLASFAAIESWSGYFRPTDPSGESTLDVGSDADNAYASVHSLVPHLAAQLARDRTLLAFYVGVQDATFVADNKQLDRELTAARVRHVFELYPGAHDVSVWEAHATQWLALALHRLEAPV
jgi:enterochelin esterase-like enzyme